MNRRGSALVLAIVTTALAAALVAVALSIAQSDLRAGTSWSLAVRTEAAAESALQEAIAVWSAGLDTIPTGVDVSIGQDSLDLAEAKVTATALGDSLLLLTADATTVSGPRGLAGGRSLGAVGRMEADTAAVAAQRKLRPLRFRPWLTLP